MIKITCKGVNERNLNQASVVHLAKFNALSKDKPVNKSIEGDLWMYR